MKTTIASKSASPKEPKLVSKYANDPVIKKKVERMNEFIAKAGIPEEWKNK